MHLSEREFQFYQPSGESRMHSYPLPLVIVDRSPQIGDQNGLSADFFFSLYFHKMRSVRHLGHAFGFVFKTVSDTMEGKIVIYV
jgi:hypothetical protein